MKTYLKHKIQNVIDIKSLFAMEYLDFEGKYKNYVESHGFWEICYIEKGKISLFIDGNEHHLSEGDLIFISPDKTHSYFSQNGNESKAFVICFECFSQSLKSLDSAHFLLKEKHKECLKQIINEYLNTFYIDGGDTLEVRFTSNFGGQQIIIILLEYLIISFIRMLSEEKKPEIVFLDEERFYQDLVDIIIDYFNDNLKRSISLDELCGKFNYSRSFLCKIFKEQTGETLFRYFNKMKIEEAKKLLRETELPIVRIAELLGFSEAKFFGATFKRVTGMSPSVYRKIKKEK